MVVESANLLGDFRRSGMQTKIVVYLEGCFARQTSPRVNELARGLGLSGKELAKACRRETGTSAADILRQAQIQRAKALLRLTVLSLNQVAYQSGFGTRRTFFRTFRSVVKITPRRYRRERDPPG